METAPAISTSQRYAAAALFALALQQSHLHKTCPTNCSGSLEDEPIAHHINVSKSVSVSDESKLRSDENSGFLSHVFRSLGLDEQAVQGLKETARSSSQFQHHVGAFLALLSEESERSHKEFTLKKADDGVLLNMEGSSVSSKVASRNHKHDTKCEELIFNAETTSSTGVHQHQTGGQRSKSARMYTEEITRSEFERGTIEKAMKDELLISYKRKLAVIYEILLACLAYNAKDDSQTSHLVQGYDARHRVALRLLATWLGINWKKVEDFEINFASSLIDLGDKEEKTEVSEEAWSNWTRGGIIGAAALTGGTLMAITGGMVAPGIAQGITALAPTMGSLVPAIGTSGFTAAASATGSVAGSVAVAASFGAAGAGLTGYEMAKRVGGIEEFEFKEIGVSHNQGRIAVGIFISGIAFEDGDFVIPWEGQNNKLERYGLQWESKELFALSTAVQDWITSKLAMELMKDGAMMTVLSTLLSALAMPAMLVSAVSLIDSQWAIAVDRSDKAGKLLADILIQKVQGNRPVTLVGFSLGARMIFRCLWFLSQTEGDNAGLVERVVLLGAPLSLKDENWDIVRKMVAGRFINAYSTNDWTLGVIFRASLLSEGLAGIQPVNFPGIENVDVTEVIEGHSSYLGKTKEILERLDLESYYPVYRAQGTKLS